MTIFHSPFLWVMTIVIGICAEQPVRSKFEVNLPEHSRRLKLKRSDFGTSPFSLKNIHESSFACGPWKCYLQEGSSSKLGDDDLARMAESALRQLMKSRGKLLKHMPFNKGETQIHTVGTGAAVEDLKGHKLALSAGVARDGEHFLVVEIVSPVDPKYLTYSYNLIFQVRRAR